MLESKGGEGGDVSVLSVFVLRSTCTATEDFVLSPVFSAAPPHTKLGMPWFSRVLVKTLESAVALNVASCNPEGGMSEQASESAARLASITRIHIIKQRSWL